MLNSSGPHYFITHLIHHIFFTSTAAFREILNWVRQSRGVWLDSEGTSATQQRKKTRTGGLVGAEVSTKRTGWNRCWPVRCCGFKQTLFNACVCTNIFIFAHTESACVWLLVREHSLRSEGPQLHTCSVYVAGLPAVQLHTHSLQTRSSWPPQPLTKILI